MASIITLSKFGIISYITIKSHSTEMNYRAGVNRVASGVNSLITASSLNSLDTVGGSATVNGYTL